MIKKTLVCLLAVASIMVACQSKDTANETANNASALHFRNGKFRIAQFTDMHWGNGVTDIEQCSEMIKQVVASQDVDLCVFTGDIVTDGDARPLWTRFMQLMEECGKPYMVLMGNHDPEQVAADSIYTWLRNEAPLCINTDYAKGIYGYGNKAIPVMGENTDSVRLVIYGLDSNDYYLPDPENSYYDFIHPDQIDWYTQESEKFKAYNGGKPIPSLAYFHICLPEYCDVVREHNYYGYQYEPLCPAGVNMGFFGRAFVEQDIVGVFVGHDHTNDFIGMYRGIALAYGRQSGVSGMIQDTPMGGRIVEMTEGKKSFETWVATSAGAEAIYYYPSGFNTSMAENAISAQDIKVKGNGVKYTYYEGVETMQCTTDMIEKGKKIEEGIFNNFDISQAKREDQFGYQFDTWFLAEETAPYVFELCSDDGAVLFIDGKMVIDNDGSHCSAKKKYYVGMEKGYHHIQINYFDDCSGQALSLKVGSTFMEMQPIPDRLLFVQ